MSGVLVGFDDSAAARRALERGIAEAQARNARLIVLSVFEVPLDPQVDRFFGTLDDVADWEGQPIAPPPELVGLGEHHHGFLAGLFGSDVATAVERELGSTVIVA